MAQTMQHIPKFYIEILQMERDFLGAQIINTNKSLQKHLLIPLKLIKSMHVLWSPFTLANPVNLYNITDVVRSN